MYLMMDKKRTVLMDEILLSERFVKCINYQRNVYFMPDYRNEYNSNFSVSVLSFGSLRREEQAVPQRLTVSA